MLLLVLALAGGAFVSWTVRRSFPQVSGSATLPGLGAPVTVERDAHGVPQIWADTAEDLFRAQGYVHAQDRFWEMDFRRHVTAGRLSELFGPDQVDTDEFVRTLGWRRVAEQELKLLDPQTVAWLQAYADGVNAWLDGTVGLGAQPRARPPRPHQPVVRRGALDAGRLGLVAQGDGLGPAQQPGRGAHPGPARRDAAPRPGRAALPGVPLRRAPRPSSAATGDAKPAARPSAASRVPSRGRVDRAARRRSTRSTALPTLLGPHGPGLGSNSWVVSGEHTGYRQAAAGQRPAPRAGAALDLVPDGPALHAGSARPARSTSPGSPSPGCRVS